MLETLHRLGSTIRHTKLLERQYWLWDRVEPKWQGTFEWYSSQRGYSTCINDDAFKLVYACGARYDRQDKGHEYEPIFYRHFVKEIREGMTVIDIGAHVGFFTLGATKRVGAKGHVFAFEPVPETLKTLRDHITLNDGQNRAESIPMVVSDTDEPVTFFAYGNSMAASLSRANVEDLNPEQRKSPAAKLKVPSVTLDRFCQQRRVKPDVLKIDVEGAELLVLRGAKELLTRQRVVVFCEIHPMQMENCRSSLPEFLAYVSSIDYEIEHLDEPNAAGIFHARITKRC